MLEDITRDIRAALYDRARSPLFVAFVVAWVAWNFDGIVVFLSHASIAEEIAAWNKLYPDHGTTLLHMVVYPLLSCGVFILIYPWPAQWAFHYWHWRSTKIKAIQQRLEDETPMTRAEEKELRRKVLEQQTAMELQLQSLNAANRDLSAQRETALQKLGEAEDQLAQLRESFTKSEKTVEEWAGKNQTLTTQMEVLSAQLDAARKGLQPTNLSDETQKQHPPTSQNFKIQRLQQAARLSELGAKVILALVNADGEPLNLGAISTRVGQSKIATDVELQKLASDGWIMYANGKTWLSDKGKQLSVSQQLTGS